MDNKDEIGERIRDNYLEVAEALHEACNRAGRERDSVTLVAVTKTATAEEVAALYNLGQRDFGENRVSDGLLRMAGLNQEDAVWHMIGHLQRNKAAEALAGFSRIHSLESEKLATVLDKEGLKREMQVEVLIEVNVSGEESKYGVSPDSLPGLIEIVLGYNHLSLCGLMTMAPYSADPEASRPVFVGLRELRDRMQEKLGIQLPDLSMGMSGDFQVAVEEGATLVRVGSALLK